MKRIKPVKKKDNWKISLLVGGSAVAIAVISFISFSSKSSRELAQELADLEEKGAITSLEDLKPAVENQPYQRTPSVEEAVAASLAEISDQNPLDIYLGLFANPRADNYDYVLDTWLRRYSKWNKGIYQEYREKLDEDQKLIEKIIEASKMQGFDSRLYDVNEVQTIGFMTYPLALHSKPMKVAANILTAKSRMLHKDGNSEEALYLCGRALDIANQLRQDPFLLSQANACVMARDTLYAVRRSLIEDMSDQNLQLFRETLNRSYNHKEFARAVDAERFWGLQYFNDMEEQGDEYEIPMPCGIEDGVVNYRLAYLGREVAERAYNTAGAFRKKDLTTYLRLMDNLINAAKLPYYKSAEIIEGINNTITPEPTPDPLSSILDIPRRIQRPEDKKISVKKFWPSRHPLANKFILPVLHGLRRQSKHEWNILELDIKIASELYKNRHGSYPDSMDALLPDYFDAVPVSPVSGNPIKITYDKYSNLNVGE
ncbi:hypothetical protein ACFL1X_02725 [Candidatus Hydrogenedentota bacterium]